MGVPGDNSLRKPEPRNIFPQQAENIKTPERLKKPENVFDIFSFTKKFKHGMIFNRKVIDFDRNGYFK